jgi:manganese efflux pump family protein
MLGHRISLDFLYIIFTKGVINMSILSIFLTGVGLSMDAFAISLAKGFCIRKNILKKSLMISILFGVAQGVMPVIGWLLSIYFESYIKSIDHWVAFILLGFIGGKMLYESFKKNDDEKLECAIDEDDLKLKEIVILAIATSIDALAVGISFAFLNVNIINAAIIIALTTFIICFFGVFFGKLLGGYLQKYSEILGGIILIGIGVKILIEHLFFS